MKLDLTSVVEVADIDLDIGAMSGEEILFAETDLAIATAAFEKAGRIEAALADRLNSRSAQIQSAADRLRRSLEKTATQS